MKIKRVIVQDCRGCHVMANPLKEPETEEAVRKAFADQKIPVCSISVDSVGCALITVGKSLLVRN